MYASNSLISENLLRFYFKQLQTHSGQKGSRPKIKKLLRVGIEFDLNKFEQRKQY